MDTRFGIKDFFLFAVLALVIVMIGLAMVQYDRQWDQVQNIKAKLEQQAVDLQTIQRTLDRGVAMRGGPSTGPATASGQGIENVQAFERITAARGMASFAEGDWLVHGLSSHIGSLTPFLGGDAYSADVLGNIFESLIARDPVTLQWQGLLAESWKIDDNSAAWTAYAEKRRPVPLTEAEVRTDPAFPNDASADEQKSFVAGRMSRGRTDDDIGREKDCPPAATITFTMRRGPTFSDGTPVTAKDVEFTYKFMMNPDINAPRERSGLTSVRDVKATDNSTVVWTFRTPYFQSLELAGGTQVMPEHFYSKFKPADYNKSTGLAMGSGPYQLATYDSWKPGDQIELSRNPRYWGVPPAFSKIVYREFTNSVAIETSFRNRDIDELPCTPERYVKLVKDTDILARTLHFEYQGSTGGYRYIAWNQMRNGKPTMFADKHVRQAMTMLIDNSRIIGDVMLNLGVPATGPFNPSSKQNDPNIKPYPYDPAKAQQLLAGAGWKDRGAGVLTNDAGEPFEFKLTYPSGIPNYQKMALLLKDFFARAKIRMNVDEQEFSVFKERLEHRDFDAISLGWSAGIENDIFQMFHSSQMADGGDDFMGYKNPELDATIEQARRTLNEDERMKLWQKTHDIIYEDQPYTFLVYPKALLFLDKRFANVQQLPLGLNPDAEWFVPAGQRKYAQ